MEREETDSVDNAGIVDNEGTMGGEAVTIEDGKDEDTGREESICDSGEDIGIEGTEGAVGDNYEERGRVEGEGREGREGDCDKDGRIEGTEGDCDEDRGIEGGEASECNNEGREREGGC